MDTEYVKFVRVNRFDRNLKATENVEVFAW